MCVCVCVCVLGGRVEVGVGGGGGGSGSWGRWCGAYLDVRQLEGVQVWGGWRVESARFKPFLWQY